MNRDHTSKTVIGRLLVSAGIGLLSSIGAAEAQTPGDKPPTMDLPTAIQSGKPIFELRLRSETVDQTGARDADALSLRTRLGWQTAPWHGLVGLIEFDDVRQVGSSQFNDGIPPAEPYAPITDPDVTELNRLQVTWSPGPAFTATLGRQRVNLDDQRFIGSVGWRQDEQTLDAVRFDSDLGALDLTYAYVTSVNRIFAEALDWDSNSHLLNASYTISDPIKLHAFVYALDFTRPNTAAVAANSNITIGGKLSGKMWIERFQLAYAGTFARQEDYGDNANTYEADYIALDASLVWGPTTFRANYESLEGEGANKRFQTPLATLHAFQGWADAFLATPNDGVVDTNVSINVKPRWRRDHLFNIDLTARYHEFETERTSRDLGQELDFSASAQITRRLGWIVKYADYDGPGGTAPQDRNKFWAGLEFKL